MNKKVLLFAVCTFFCQLIFTPVFAIRAIRTPITITQPDGSQLTIHLNGDEFNHFQTSEDGYLLKANAKGFLTYAKVDASGVVVESEYVAKNVNKRTMAEAQFLKTINQAAVIQKVQSSVPSKSRAMIATSQPRKAYPLIGSPRSLVILVNFSDVSYVTPTPQAAYTNLLNQPDYSTNGGTGCARDYFMASSYGKFAPTFDVVGPYTLPQTMAYYGANSGGTAGNDIRPQQMVIDACTLASQNGLDFTQYDTDNDGYVDNIFVYYAGYNEAEGGPANSIWPHRWSLANTSTVFNGKIVYDYSCTSELQGNTGSSMCGIGTFCHEFGHVLGLPDYYDTTGSQAHTLDDWDIMDYGAYLNSGRTPPTYSVYDRFFLGFLTPEQISTGANETLLPLYQGKTQPDNTTNQAFLFSATNHNLSGSSPSPSEFFMVEYRKKTGWDAYLPTEGLCIWHIDYNQTAWDNNEPNNYTGSTQTAASHMRVYLQPLSGSTTTPGSAFTSGAFTPLTWTGVDINRAITNITKTNANITFRFMPPKISAAASLSAFSTYFGTPATSQNITVTALNLIDNLNLSFQNNVNFETKLSTDNSWSNSLSIVPVAGSVNATINVRYNPKSTGTQTDQLSIIGTDLTTSNFNLSGTSILGPNSPVIFAGVVDNSILFYPTSVNTSNIRTLKIKTTDIIGDLSLAITGADSALFAASVTSVTKAVANSTDGTTITITYTPTISGTHSAILTISGGGLHDKVISLNGSAI